MYESDRDSKATNNCLEDRVFLYEVIFGSQRIPVNSAIRLTPQRGKILLKVPYSRMNQEMQRISRLGGKIVSIKPLSSAEQVIPQTDIHLPWWLEISTIQPLCCYYFGPFESPQEAQRYQPGYVEDLKSEGAEGIVVQLKQCQPDVLTLEW
jgi:hypothetical protein